MVVVVVVVVFVVCVCLFFKCFGMRNVVASMCLSTVALSICLYIS